MKSKKFLLIISVMLLLSLIVMPMTVSAGKYGPDMKADADTWDRSEGEAENVIDRYEDTIWHSLWDVPAAIADGFEDAVSQSNKFPQILVVEFDNVYTLDCIGYLSRDAFTTSNNGTVTAYEFWASETGTIADLQTDDGWIMIASGEWKASDTEFKEGLFKMVDFEAVKAKSVKFKVLKGVGGWASCAELQFGFTDVGYVPMVGFTPRTTPLPMPEPETEPVTDPPATEAPTEAAAIDEVSASTTAAEPTTGDTSPDIIIIIIIAAVVIVAAVVVIIIVKSKGKKGK